MGWLQWTKAQIVHLAVKMGNILAIFYFWNILRWLLSLIIYCIQLYIYITIFMRVERSSVTPKRCVFPPKKEDERHFCLCSGIYAYIILCTLEKMHNISTLMCKMFQIWRQSILKVIQAFHSACTVLYIWFCLIVCFVALRPKSTAMVFAGWLTSNLCTYFRL